MRWLVAILFIPCCSFGQITFHKVFGGDTTDFAWAVEQTADGGYILAGGTNSYGPGGRNGLLMKLTADGDTSWVKIISGDSLEGCYGVSELNDGSFIVAGYTRSAGQGGNDALLIKTNSAGNVLWAKAYGGPSPEGITDVRQTVDSGFIMAGITYSFGQGNGDAYLIKTNQDGDLEWTRTYGTANADWVYVAKQTQDGGYILTGTTLNPVQQNWDALLIKTDNTGDTLWTKIYGGPGWEFAPSVDITADGGYILTGRTDSYGVDSTDAFLIKTDNIGDTLWSKTYGGPGHEAAWSVQQTTDGGYVMAGYTTSFGAGKSDTYLAKTDTAGEVQWSRMYGLNDYEGANMVIETTDKGYMIAGYSYYGTSEDNGFIMKTDSVGSSNCNESEVLTSVNNAPMVIGGGLIVGSGGVETNTTITDYNLPIFDSLLCHCNQAITAGFGYSDSLLTVSFSNSSSGSSSWYWDFGDGNTDTVQSPSHTYSNPGTYQVCLIAMNDCNSDTICDSITVTDVGIGELSKEKFRIYPNPTNGVFTVAGTTGSIEVLDIFGRLVLTTTEPQIDLSHQPSGIYFVRAGQAVRKLVLR